MYPAAVTNWNREREDALDVTHFVETADRQTGMYAEIGNIDEDALENAVAACCSDSQCLKRREWDASESEEIDVPRGDGEFPCREPCSLFVAAVREFLATERGIGKTNSGTKTNRDSSNRSATRTSDRRSWTVPRSRPSATAT
ncbi:hypothetical protein [Haladaptatus pallidirubidus]|uniref:hypothetical protein n=1 Tax=Haladaptatus pallidirubidus TaxID=1008152 RepID=UPI00406BC064